MKKLIFGIFAHPDDEAFGPAATLIKEVHAGSDVYLICATAGEAGANPDSVPDLKATRLKEWQQAAELIGACDTNHLGYVDGTLCNDNFLPIAHQVIDYIKQHVSGDDTLIELMSFDTTGISGHIDHIVMSRVAHFVYYSLKPNYRVRLRLACVAKAQFPEANIAWIYMDAGREGTEITETVDARDIHPLHKQVMECHRSQRGDYESHHEPRGENASINHFIVIE